MKKYRNNASPCIILRIPSEIFMRAKCRRINIVRAMLLLDRAKWNPENLWATMQIIRKICTSIGPQNYDGYRSKSMKLYHFCSDKHIKSIMRQGLNTGAVVEPTDHGYIMHSGYIWLTKDPDPNNQSWATQHIVRYNRVAWRLTIEIPHEEENQIFDRECLAKVFPGSGPLFDGWAGSENWRVFKGMIPRDWITAAERMI